MVCTAVTFKGERSLTGKVEPAGRGRCKPASQIGVSATSSRRTREVVQRAIVGDLLTARRRGRCLDGPVTSYCTLRNMGERLRVKSKSPRLPQQPFREVCLKLRLRLVERGARPLVGIPTCPAPRTVSDQYQRSSAARGDLRRCVRSRDRPRRRRRTRPHRRGRTGRVYAYSGAWPDDNATTAILADGRSQKNARPPGSGISEGNSGERGKNIRLPRGITTNSIAYQVCCHRRARGPDAISPCSIAA